MTPRHRLPEKNYKVVKTAAGQFSQIDPVFSSDSRYIFAATGSTVKVLKITTCAVVRSLEHPHPVKAFMLNPKNKLQLMVACDKTVYVWDWQDGVLLKTVKMDHPITHMFSALKSTESVYYVVLDPENNNGRSFYKCDLDFDESNTRHLFDTPYFESFTYASNGSFFATAHEYDITVTFENGTSETYTTPGKKATSLHINVRDDVVAAGCNNGEIRLIPCANGKLDMAAVASNHWHKNPVPAVRFLGDGVTLLSGGEETVLVFWNTLFQRRHFVPRVGGPIKSIVASPNHALYALLLGNNLIQLINSTTRDIQYSIQGLQTPAVHTPTCLMAREPRNKHLAFSSSPGTIQFYDYALDKHNSTLEVAPQNYNVHHIAFSRDGRWMATVDTLEKETSGSLKFWEWNEDEQFYKLHTSILNFEVSKKGTLLFNNARGNDGLMALTTSGGKTFKVWMLEQAAEKGVVWKCRSENSFRNYSPNAAAFSADDSIIAVGFDRLITLWDTFENKVMDALVQPSGYQVQELHFLGDSPFMLSVTKHEFAVWNILTMDVWYSYNVPCQFVAVDRHSNRFAVIARLFNTSAKQLLVFSPDSSIPESCTPLTNSILGMEFDKEIVLVTNDYSILQLSATTPETAKEERAEIEDVPETGIFDSVFGRRQQEAREAAEQASLTEKIRQGEANVQEALALLAGPSQSLPGVSDVFESIMTSLMELRVVDKTVEEGQQVDVAMEEQEEMDQDTTLDITLQSNFKLDKFSDLKFPSLVDKASISKAKAEESSSSSEESEEEEDPSDIAW